MEKKPSSGLKKAVKIILFVLLAALVIAALRFAYVMFIDPMSAFRGQGNSATPAPAASAPSEAPDPTAPPSPTATPRPRYADLTPEPTPSDKATPRPPATPVPTLDPEFMDDRVNILILGWDESPERRVEGTGVYRDSDNNFRSDVIMLLTVNFRTDRVDLISIPRDTYAAIYTDKGELFSETGRWKINAAFAKGGSADGIGFKYTAMTVSKLLGGVPIDYYAGVDMTGLKAVVDAMGGVYYDVDISTRINGRDIIPGYQLMTGQQVLDYCRARKGISTDIGRTSRQQRILFTIFDQLKSRDQLKNFVNIYYSVRDYIHTNLNTEQIAALASYAMGVDMDDLHRKTLEGDYINNTAYNNASYYVLYNDKLQQLIKTVYGVEIVPSPVHDYFYVLGDKSAKLALEYVRGADYLVALAGGDPAEATSSSGGLGGGLSGNGEQTFYTVTLIKQIVAAKKAATAAATRGMYDDVNLPLDAAAIDAATAELRPLMSALATELHLTRITADEAQLPADFYKALPKE